MQPERSGASPFLTTKEAAVYLRVSQRTLQNWRYANTGPSYRKHVGVVVYHIDDLNAFSEKWIQSGGGKNGA
ncbi:helix-turn-helix domain-containing protein [Hyphomonas oceanitis]|uniref:helix-turn-helix domain-containing protein n=1 Tax=Hyphomonas oceanitis TaxID=81033 RepID=UPI0030018D74